MKITILKDNLKKALNSVERVTGMGNTLPILKNILIKTENGRIKIVATDLEVSITSFVNGKIIKEGGITISSQLFSSILNNISDSKLELELDSKSLKIKTSNSENKIQGIKQDDFPIIPKYKKENNIEIKSSILKESLIQVIPATTPSDRRIELNGILFWIEKNKFKMVTTDGFRLAEKLLSSNNFKTNIEDLKIIIPLKTCQEIVKLLENEFNVKIFIEPHQIVFEFEDIVIISKLIEGNFPEYKNRIPKKNKTEIIISKNQLFDAIKLASIFVGKINDIKIQVKDNNIEVFGNSSAIGENKSIIKAEIDGEDQELILNWRFLLDGLRVINNNEVFIGLNGELEPIFIKSNQDNNYFYLLMPIKG
jgi:DNA polymerase-3 subunit beta